jgi:tRNA-splicing ligase RtcB
MGEKSVILKGATWIQGCEQFDREEMEKAMFSTVHGAGRVMSRTEARGKYHRKTGECIRPGRVEQREMDDWLDFAGVELRGGGLDEAPQAYKRLNEVLVHHKSGVVVEHLLTPLGVAMA